jgi:hypothetical protein
MAIMRMSKVYRRICTKVYNPAEFESLQADVAESMALLEMEFPPSFFDIVGTRILIFFALDPKLVPKPEV